MREKEGFKLSLHWPSSWEGTCGHPPVAVHKAELMKVEI